MAACSLEALAAVFVVLVTAKRAILMLKDMPALPRRHEFPKEVSPQFWELNALSLCRRSLPRA